jgi:hypothetical protein
MTKDHVQLLTFSQGVVADWERKNQISSFLAPEVVVGGGIYHYKDYGLGNAFTPIEMRRAVGGPTKMLAVSVNDLSDINREYSLGTFIDDQERERNPADISVLEQRKITDLVATCMNNNLYLVLSAARAGLTPFTVGSGANQIPAPFSGGAWSTTTNDPVNDINLACKYVADTYGILPNRIYFDSRAWLIYINNPLVRGRFQGVLVQSVNTSNAASMWNIPLDAKVNQGALYEGGTSFSDVIIFFGQDAPSQYDTSFMKTFTNVAGRFTRIRSWRDENTSSDRYKCSFYQNIKLTGQATAVRITIA